MMQKNVLSNTPDSKSISNVKIGGLLWGKIAVSKLGGLKY